MIPKGKKISCDTETTGLWPWNGCRAFYFSFCNEDGDTSRMRWKVDPFTRMPEQNWKDMTELVDFFADERRIKIFHNSKFDIRMLEFWGIAVLGRVEDTYFASHVLRSNEFSHGLKPLAKKYVDFPDDDEKTLHKVVAKERLKAKKLGWNIAQKGRDGKDPVRADYWLAPSEILDPYGVGDVERTMLLHHVFDEQLDNDPICRKFYERELELQKVTYKMETRGVRVRPEVVRKEIALNEAHIAKCIGELRKELGTDFNPNSNQQVQNFVYGKLKFPVQVWTPSGQPSVDSEALQGIDHPQVRLLQEHNSCQKAITNFFQKYIDNAHEDSEGHTVLHPDFNQVGPATGRFSCRNPNLQNVANALTTRSSIPIQARTPFCPRMGKVWYCPDYSSEEVWIFADGAKETRMLEALYAGRDLHGEVADFIWGAGTVAREKAEGKKTSRAKAKMLLFGIVYGMGVASCADFLKCSRNEAEDVLWRYKNFFPRIDPFMKEIVERVQSDGFIQTAWGRKIFVDRDYAYKATNYYVQGTGADVMKEAMLRVDKFLEKSRMDARLIMTIHDELVIEIGKKDATPDFLGEIVKIMEDHQGHLGIKKLPVSMARVTKTWNLKEEIKDLALI